MVYLAVSFVNWPSYKICLMSCGGSSLSDFVRRFEVAVPVYRFSWSILLVWPPSHPRILLHPPYNVPRGLRERERETSLIPLRTSLFSEGSLLSHDDIMQPLFLVLSYFGVLESWLPGLLAQYPKREIKRNQTELGKREKEKGKKKKKKEKRLITKLDP